MFRNKGGVITRVIEFNSKVQILCSNPTTSFTGIFAYEDNDVVALTPFTDQKLTLLLGDSFPNAKKLVIPKKNIMAIWVLTDEILNGEEYEKRRIKIKS